MPTPSKGPQRGSEKNSALLRRRGPTANWGFFNPDRPITGLYWTSQAEQFSLQTISFFMKKIEAVIDRSAAKTVELLLAKTGKDGRPVFAEVSIVESRGRFYALRGAEEQQSKWKPCVRLDLFVPDCETASAVDIILQHSNLPESAGGRIDILPLEATFEISAR
jgi:nitrogen regulatory protein PII